MNGMIKDGQDVVLILKIRWYYHKFNERTYKSEDRTAGRSEDRSFFLLTSDS